MEIIMVATLGVFVGVAWYWMSRLLRRREVKRDRQDTHREQVAMRAFQKAFTVQAKEDRDGMSSWEIAWQEHCESIERSVNRGDFDTARRMLQKISYGMADRKNVTDAQRAEFTRYMADFAKLDPLYQQILTEIRALLAAKNGALQSELFKALSHHDIEMLRYTTYFAHETGDLVRKKKGRSYLLYMPGEMIDADEVGNRAKKRRDQNVAITISGEEPTAKNLNQARRSQQTENADNQPYWQYIAIMDPLTCDWCRSLHGLVFRYDDPIWDRFYPPNGKHCRCQVNALSQRRLEANGLVVVSSASIAHRLPAAGRPCLAPPLATG